MQAGTLRHRVLIEQQTSVRDGFGAQQQAWATFSTLSARVEILSGAELQAAQKIVADVNATVTIRFLAGVLPEMRVRWDDAVQQKTRLFDILAPLPDERNREIQLLCKERDIKGAAGPVGAQSSGGVWGRKNFNEAPDGARTVFTLPVPVLFANSLQVYVNFLMASSNNPQHYTVSGNQVTFLTPPAATDVIFAYC